MTIFFKPQENDRFEMRFYAIFSTETAQDGNIVYTNTNTKLVFGDIKQQLEDGHEIIGLDNTMPLLKILEDTDGCAVQYHSKYCLDLE